MFGLKLPQHLLHYLHLIRFFQPTGIYLLAWPCVWSLCLASDKGDIPFTMIVLFVLGAFFMRSAGCVINDLWDRDFDRQVERTKSRPLASGALSVTQAFICLALLLSGAGIIFLQLQSLTQIIAILSLIPVALYPLMKRITYWPQLFLGITFNLGVLMGWAEITGTLPIQAFTLYTACIFWTVGYDSIYGHQDKKDDISIGVKSTALLWKHNSKIWIAGCYLISVISWVATLYIVTAPFLSYICALIYAVHCTWQVWHVNLNIPTSCMQVFRSNKLVGWILLAAALSFKIRQALAI